MPHGTLEPSTIAESFFWLHSAQARSHAYVSRVAKLSFMNHVVQNLRTYLILDVITKERMCVEENIELSGISQNQARLSLPKISGDFSLSKKVKQHLKIAKS